MKKKHIILRTTNPSTRDFLFESSIMRATVAERIARGVFVEVDEIDKNMKARLERSSEILGIAPVMPIKLITPVEIQDTTVSVNDLNEEITWGVKAVGADTSPFSGDGIIVSVLDTGIDKSHLAFSGMKIIQKNFTDEDDSDLDGHGTHCAGTIFGRNIDGKRIGVAPGVKKALIGKVIGKNGGGSDQIIQGIQWAVDNGANVISMSIGMDFPGAVKELIEQGFNAELATSKALEGYRINCQLFERMAALTRARVDFGQPTVLIAAAGNESRRELNPDFEIEVSPPAVAEGFISVAAIQKGIGGFSVADFSNTGANVSAPGVQILSAEAGSRDKLVSLNGTSMATPHVAGVAALWAERIKKVSSLTPLELTSRLIGSASTDGMIEGIDPSDIGAGIVRAPQ